MKLTARNVQALAITNRKDEQIYWADDVRNLGLRLRRRADGEITRTLIFQFGRMPRIKIGTVGAIDFADAVKIAKKYYGRCLLGENPSRDRAEAKIASAEIVRSFLPRFLSHQRERLRPRTYPDLERHLLVHARALHGIPLTKVTRRDIAAVTSSVAENTSNATSNHVRSALSTFWSWAVAEGLTADNVVIGTIKREQRARTRVLTPTELRLIWTHAGDGHYGAILRLLALTGARANEIAALCWSEVRGDLILLPAPRVKNDRPHEIPLSAAARAIIEAQPRRLNLDGTPRDLIFGTGAGPFAGWSNSKDKLNARVIKATGQALPDWRPHDLRRSFSTHANELGIAPPHIIEACLGHVSGFRAGVSGTYNLARYRSEARTALDHWADVLLSWIEGRESNVVSLSRSA